MNTEPLALYGYDLFGDPVEPKKSGPLAERFEFPPFSVLNGREGAWQDRKRAWLSLGIQSEIGRDGNTKAPTSPQALAGGYHENGSKAATADSQRLAPGGGGGGAWLGGPQTTSSEAFGNTTKPTGAGTSIFDPVLAELAYRWFCVPGGQILDPFAGGSVRGIVAGLLGYRYHGIDLSAPQVAANEQQRTDLAPYAPVTWAVGDSLELLKEAPEADFIFTCPPYGDLERYSDDKRDLSTMEYHTFVSTFRRIVLGCMLRLREPGLACLVVGDFRDKQGMYRGFVADTIAAFRDVGMPLYNDAIFITPAGSLPIRVSSQFPVARKLGKTHQNVLVFAKGDPREIEWPPV